MIPIINSYIEKRYERWLDYATYHSEQASIPDHAVDILNEVMLSLLNKGDEVILSLLNKKKGQYTELDFFILRMIKLNCTSITSHYYNRYKPRLTNFDQQIDVFRLKIIDEQEDSIDMPALLLKEYRLFRYVANGLDMTEREREIFEFKAIDEVSFSEWPGPETSKQLYEIYNTIKSAIHEILFIQGFTKVRPKNMTKPRLTKYRLAKAIVRKNELVENFLQKHKLIKQKKSSSILV